MNKNEILQKLNELDLDKNKYIVISGASLVVQDIIPETSDIDMTTSLDYYNSINWPESLGHMGKPIKSFDLFEISNNLYEENAKTITITGYKFLNLKDILKTKKVLNREKDYYIIKKLEDMLK